MVGFIAASRHAMMAGQRAIFIMDIPLARGTRLRSVSEYAGCSAALGRNIGKSRAVYGYLNRFTVGLLAIDLQPAARPARQDRHRAFPGGLARASGLDPMRARFGLQRKGELVHVSILG